MEIHIAHAKLSDLAVDAIVLPCHSEGVLTTGVHRIIKDESASALEAKLKAKSPLAIGAAMIAASDAVKAGMAILVPISKDSRASIATELLRKAVKAALVAARIKDYKTLALPSLIDQDANITVAEAARSVIQEIYRHDDLIPTAIYLAAPEERLVRIFEDAVQHARHASHSAL